MTTLDLANQALGKLKGIKFPVINRNKVMKFINEAFLDLDDNDSHTYQQPKTKLKE